MPATGGRAGAERGFTAPGGASGVTLRGAGDDGGEGGEGASVGAGPAAGRAVEVEAPALGEEAPRAFRLRRSSQSVDQMDHDLPQSGGIEGR